MGNLGISVAFQSEFREFLGDLGEHLGFPGESMRCGVAWGDLGSQESFVKRCGNGKQLQAQKEEIINLTQKRLKRDFFPFCTETQK